MSFLHRYLSDHPVYSAQFFEFGQFSELTAEVYQQLINVGRLAADGIERCEYIFECVSCESMGLLRKVEDMYIGHGHLPSHSFLHLTHQEFLATWYWSHALSFRQLKELVIVDLTSSLLTSFCRVSISVKGGHPLQPP